MKIASFDLGSHIGIAENQSDPLGNGIHWELKGKRAERAAQFQLLLEDFFAFRDQQFDVVFYERPFARGMAATRAGWGLAGVLEAVAMNFQVPCVEMPPATLKVFATGSGKASKEDMTAAAQIMGYDGDNEHVADAWCGLRYAEATCVKGK